MENTQKVGMNVKRFNFVNKMVIQPRFKDGNEVLEKLVDVSAKHPQEKMVTSRFDQNLK